MRRCDDNLGLVAVAFDVEAAFPVGIHRRDSTSDQRADGFVPVGHGTSDFPVAANHHSSGSPLRIILLRNA